MGCFLYSLSSRSNYAIVNPADSDALPFIFGAKRRLLAELDPRASPSCSYWAPACAKPAGLPRANRAAPATCLRVRSKSLGRPSLGRHSGTRNQRMDSVIPSPASVGPERVLAVQPFRSSASAAYPRFRRILHAWKPVYSRYAKGDPTNCDPSNAKRNTSPLSGLR